MSLLSPMLPFHTPAYCRFFACAVMPKNKRNKVQSNFIVCSCKDKFDLQIYTGIRKLAIYQFSDVEIAAWHGFVGNPATCQGQMKAFA
ncbi:hypothetical protein ACO0LK_16230 [Undibacterium sp. Ji49W]